MRTIPHLLLRTGSPARHGNGKTVAAKDPDPIYLRASFFRATTAGVGGFPLLAVLVYVADEDPAAYAGAGTL